MPRSVVFVLLAIGALFARLPWEEFVGPASTDALGVTSRTLLVSLAAYPTELETVGVALEFLLIWLVLYTVLPVLYPSRARRLTTTLPFRAGVATLATAAALVVFLAVAHALPTVVLFGLLASTFVVAIVVTTSTNNWCFSTPYVSPVFAVLSSFVPTSRVTEFAASFRRCETDHHTRLLYQGLLGTTTVGFVLITGVLSALPPLIFPSLEVLTIAAVAVVSVRRLGRVRNTTRRRTRRRTRLFRRYRPRRLRRSRSRTRRPTRSQTRTIRRVFGDVRGTTAALFVTTGTLLGTSVVVLGVSIAVSAARRTPVALRSPETLFTPNGIVVEWLVVGYLLLHAAAIAWFWSRMIGQIPTLCLSVQQTVRSDGGGYEAAVFNRPPRRRVVRPAGLLVAPSLLLVVAVWLLYPRSVPGTNSALLLVLAVVLASLTTVQTWFPHRRPLRFDVPERYRLPVAFAVQWIGTMGAITLLPGYTLGTVLPVTVLVLILGVGSYFYTEVKESDRTVGSVSVRSLYLVGLSLACLCLLWLTDDTLLGYAGPLLWPLTTAAAVVAVAWLLYQLSRWG